MSGAVQVVTGAAAGWAAVMLLTLFWLAGRHWVTAWLVSSALAAAAWGLIESVVFGPVSVAVHWAEPRRWPGDLRHDAALLLGWASPVKPWQLAAAVGLLGAWCKTRHVIRSRRAEARVALRAARAAAAQVPPPVVVLPPPDPDDWRRQRGRGR